MGYYGSESRFPGIYANPELSGLVDRTRGGAEAIVPATGTAGAITLDCSLASIFTLVPTGAVTSVTLLNPPKAGLGCFVQLRVAQGATAFAIATPAGGNFFDAATPTQVINKVCWFTYASIDGGATWDCWGSVQV
jgi:hypothetical protein